MAKTYALIKVPVEGRILFVRGHKVLLDDDLAERRNAERFPADFMFRLTPGENKKLRLQFATSSQGKQHLARRGGQLKAVGGAGLQACVAAFFPNGFSR